VTPKEQETLAESQELEWKSGWAEKMRCAYSYASCETTHFHSIPINSAIQVSLDSLVSSKGLYAWVDQRVC
jgi:hypothetical protein